MLAFEIPGPPIGKGRPRVTRNGHAYTPERTRGHEDVIRFYAAQAQRETGALVGRVGAELTFYLPDRRHEPDLDNLIKAVLDACNGIIYADDRQIVHLQAYKFFDKANPRTEATFVLLEP